MKELGRRWRIDSSSVNQAFPTPLNLIFLALGRRICGVAGEAALLLLSEVRGVGREKIIRGPSAWTRTRSGTCTRSSHCLLAKKKLEYI